MGEHQASSDGPPDWPAARIFAAEDMEAAESIRTAAGAAAVCSRRSPAKDTPNEDSAAVWELPSGAVVLAVADGVGGEQWGDRASQLTLACLQ